MQHTERALDQRTFVLGMMVSDVDFNHMKESYESEACVTLDEYRDTFYAQAKRSEAKLDAIFADAFAEVVSNFPKLERFYTRCPRSPDISNQWQKTISMAAEFPNESASQGKEGDDSELQGKVRELMQRLPALRFASFTNLVSASEAEGMKSRLQVASGEEQPWVIFPERTAEDKSEKTGALPETTVQAVREALAYCQEGGSVRAKGVVTSSYYFDPEQMVKFASAPESKDLDVVSLGNACNEGTLRRFIGCKPQECVEILFNAKDIILADPALAELEGMKPGLLDCIMKTAKGQDWHEMRRKKLLIKFRDMIENMIKKDDVDRLRQMQLLGVALGMGQHMSGCQTLLHIAAENGASKCVGMLMKPKDPGTSGPTSCATKLLYISLQEMPKSAKRSLLLCAAKGGIATLFTEIHKELGARGGPAPAAFCRQVVQRSWLGL